MRSFGYRRYGRATQFRRAILAPSLQKRTAACAFFLEPIQFWYTPLSILSRRLALFACDTRLGLRLVSRKWKQDNRAKRKRIAIAAVISLLPLSAAIPTLAAAPAALELDQSQILPVVESIATPAVVGQVAQRAREDTHLREVRLQRGETLAALFGRLGISDAVALCFAQTDPVARPLVRLALDRPR